MAQNDRGVQEASETRLSASDDATETLLRVGRRIRRLRQQRKFRQQDVATMAGISPSMLSLVERGLVSPSLTTLAAMAHGFGISLTELIAGRDDPDDGLTRLADLPVVKTPDGVLRWVMAEDQTRKVDITVNLYAAGIANAPNGVRHSGYEYGFVLEGELTVEIDGTSYLMGEGDLIALDSRRRHKIWNHAGQDARALWINVGRDDLGPEMA